MKLNKRIIILVVSIFSTLSILFYLTVKSNDVKNTDHLQFQNQLFDSIPQKLVNLSFRFITTNEKLCDNQTEEILAIIIVTSYFGNVETRNSMRKAFSNEKLKQYKLRRVFLLGEAPNNEYNNQQSVCDENKQFEDIIQGNFLEAYRNLTYKHVMGLKWASTYCSRAKYIIKMDDDIIVNMYKLESIINLLQKLSKKDFIAGYVLRNLKPIREPDNKWYVTKEEYSPSSYPQFVSGWFYVTNPMSARKLVALANYEKYFWIDDLFVTGILAKKLKIKQYDISKHFTPNSEFLQCCLQDLEKNIDCDIDIGPNGADNDMFFKFNHKVEKCFVQVGNCISRTRPLNETCVAERKTNLGRGKAVVRNFRLK